MSQQNLATEQSNLGYQVRSEREIIFPDIGDAAVKM